MPSPAGLAALAAAEPRLQEAEDVLHRDVLVAVRVRTGVTGEPGVQEVEDVLNGDDRGMVEIGLARREELERSSARQQAGCRFRARRSRGDRHGNGAANNRSGGERSQRKPVGQ